MAKSRVAQRAPALRGRRQTDCHSERAERAKNLHFLYDSKCRFFPRTAGQKRPAARGQNDMLQNVCQKNKNLRPCNADFVSRFAGSAPFLYGFTDKPQSFQKQETLRYRLYGFMNSPQEALTAPSSDSCRSFAFLRPVGPPLARLVCLQVVTVPQLKDQKMPQPTSMIPAPGQVLVQ